MKVVAKACLKHVLWGVNWLATGRDLARWRVCQGPAKGTWMELDLRKEGSYWLGNYDDWILQRLKLSRWIKPGQVVWDAGAYVGYYTAIFRRLVGEQGRVITFEASSLNYARVARLPEINHWTNVEVRHQAIGPDHSFIDFAYNLGGSSGPVGLTKQFAPETRVEIEKIACVGVDELVYELGVSEPDFIKFDLETAEEYALHNGQRLFTGKRPLLLLELHGDGSVIAAGRFLENYDYAAFDILQMDHPGAKASRSLNGLKSRSPASHMLFCFPNSRVPDLISALPPS